MALQVRGPLRDSRTMGKYLTEEYIALAKLGATEFIIDDYHNPDTEELRKTLTSLERFNFALRASVYDTETGNWVGWCWVISQEGRTLLKQLRPRWEGCRCEDAIKLPCVCSERTYCPHGHPRNGCHGTHD